MREALAVGTERHHHVLQVTEDDAGKRLDRFLAERLPDRSRTELARWIRDGTAARILKARRAEMNARRRQVLTALRGHRVECPDGSLHIWLHLPEPWRSTDFAAEARRRGVGVTPAEAFAVGRSHLTHAVRLCHGAPAYRKTLDRALSVVRDLLNESPPETYGSVV